MIKTICFTEAAWEDYVWWQRQDQKTLRRINQLIHNACRTPFEGLGKPEPLRESLSGFWSRRIDQANRLVYEDTDRALNVVSCRYHYG
ncbi:Addiction module toxin YoeB [Candidatus Glomeribacter gigasporarum BEG34]|uniref:Putative mRNA interferase YoeB n=1 Tax=Candidatus Glomeribacter gigasporarum BEG34 TaxID=1070319 RepID=G2J8P0_9BURK|nr:Txe/YoeB family addiction module toxin [Candidatus Glomeribacter gigasporarum]CCD29137.1 Addiction module toxin YoeB [Candidatus Glomeribacter gigasporarum BEG34]